MSEEHIYKTLFSLLNAQFLEEIVFYKAYQTQEKTFEKYATIYIISENVIKSKKEYFDRENPKEKQSSLSQFVMQVDFNSDVDDLMSLVNRVKAFLKSDRVNLKLKENGLFLNKMSNIRSLPEIEKERWNYKKTFDLHFHFTQTHEFDVDYILEPDLSKG